MTCHYKAPLTNSGTSKAPYRPSRTGRPGDMKSWQETRGSVSSQRWQLDLMAINLESDGSSETFLMLFFVHSLATFSASCCLPPLLLSPFSFMLCNKGVLSVIMLTAAQPLGYWVQKDNRARIWTHSLPNPSCQLWLHEFLITGFIYMRKIYLFVSNAFVILALAAEFQTQTWIPGDFKTMLEIWSLSKTKGRF